MFRVCTFRRHFLRHCPRMMARYCIISPPPPPPLCSKPFQHLLPSRSLLQLKGRGVRQFLQGLMTCDVLSCLSPSHPVWGCFLHFNGKVIADAYVYQQPGGDESLHERDAVETVWIEVEAGEHQERLLEHLLEMRMRTKVSIADCSEAYQLMVTYRGTTINGSSSASSSALDDTHTPILCAPDPRSDAILAPSPPPIDETAPAAPSLFTKSIIPITAAAAAATSTFLPYHALLLSHGVWEGPLLFPSGRSLPFDGNADILCDGISFDKGCYIGQELTHRTHVMLITRRRLMPVIVRQSTAGASTPTPSKTALFTADGAPAGTLLLCMPEEPHGEQLLGNPMRGIAMVRLPYIFQEKPLGPGEGPKSQTAGSVTLWSKDRHLEVSVYRPSWWQEGMLRETFKRLRKASDRVE